MLPSLQVQIQGQSTISSDNLNTYLAWCNSVTTLRGFIGIGQMAVYLEGTVTPGDGGQGTLYWNATGTAPDDNGVTTVVPNGVVAGEWTRIGLTGATVSALNVTGNATVGGTLGVTGVTTLTGNVGIGTAASGSTTLTVEQGTTYGVQVNGDVNSDIAAIQINNTSAGSSAAVAINLGNEASSYAGIISLNGPNNTGGVGANGLGINAVLGNLALYAAAGSPISFPANTVAINCTPSTSAILDVQSTTQGLRLPNMTTTQKNAISNPAQGLLVFDTTLSKACVYVGGAWQTITSS